MIVLITCSNDDDVPFIAGTYTHHTQNERLISEHLADSSIAGLTDEGDNVLYSVHPEVIDRSDFPLMEDEELHRGERYRIIESETP